MQPTWKTVLASAAVVGVGATSSLAQTPAQVAAARSAYAPAYPAGASSPVSALSGYVPPAPTMPATPAPVAAMTGYPGTAPVASGYPTPGTNLYANRPATPSATAMTPRGASDPSVRTAAMTPNGTGDPSIKPGPPPYPPAVPPKEPSRMRKAFRFLFLSRSESGDGTRKIHIDPATGRTDLANARPWLDQYK